MRPLLLEAGLTCTRVQIKNHDFFASRACYLVAILVTGGLILSKSNSDKEPDPLIDGTLETLERECIDEGVCRWGV